MVGATLQNFIYRIKIRRFFQQKSLLNCNNWQKNTNLEVYFVYPHFRINLTNR